MWLWGLFSIPSLYNCLKLSSKPNRRILTSHSEAGNQEQLQLWSLWLLGPAICLLVCSPNLCQPCQLECWEVWRSRGTDCMTAWPVPGRCRPGLALVTAVTLTAAVRGPGGCGHLELSLSAEKLGGSRRSWNRCSQRLCVSRAYKHTKRIKIIQTSRTNKTITIVAF